MTRRKAPARPSSKRVIAYVRVSSAIQAESGLGLEAQRAKVAQYAQLYGLTVVEVIEDAGYSAKSMRRPGIARALQMLESGEVDGLLIAKLDRLSRSLKDWSTLIDRHFGDRARFPATLYSVGDSIDTASAAGRLVLNLLMSVAEWERETISERTTDALEAKRARGEVWGGHNAIVRQEGGPEVMVRIRALRAEGLTVRAIATRLNQDGVPARGKAWHATTVARLLQRAA